MLFALMGARELLVEEEEALVLVVLEAAARLRMGLPDNLAQMRWRRPAMAGMQVQMTLKLHSTDDQMTALLYSQVGLEEWPILTRYWRRIFSGGREGGRKGVRICFVCIIEREEERKLALTILQMVTNMPTIKMVRTPVFLRQEMLSLRKLCNGRMKTTTS